MIEDFFHPALKASSRYDRGVGYFSSGWIKTNSAGLADFAERGGTARFITSPILSEGDWKALKTGSDAKDSPVLRRVISRNLDDLARELQEDTLNALSWLVADEILDFKLAVPANDLTGEFHDKFGIFTDEYDNKVLFNGSYNDSIQGLRNYESLKLFFSWKEDDVDIIAADQERFQRLWENRDPNVKVFDIPSSAREQILDLRTGGRPYTSPAAASGPKPPEEITARPYQKEAIQSWFQNDGRGILKMATGTGKTITALLLISKVIEVLREREKGIAVVIMCPYQHLVDQWTDELKNFGFSPVKCFKSYKRWKDKLNSRITEVNLGSRDHLVAIVTNSTFRTSTFQKSLAGIRSALMIVSDEVHNAGAPNTKKLLPMEAQYRLGLSATPERWFDEDGTEDLYDYFGIPVFEYDLEEAIENGYLVKYRYHPILVDLTMEELEDYLHLTTKIAHARQAEEDLEENEALQRLLIRRARLTASAEQKIPRLLEELRQEDLIGSSHNLFYCGDGRVGTNQGTHDEEQRQIEALVKALGKDLEMKVAPYVAETPSRERRTLLRDFAQGELEGLVAIRCLDEGVDVPATRRAFILASSSNPRQFIQRRGRILRTAPGKDRAAIWDFLVVPPVDSLDASIFNTERRMIQKELMRVLEFAELAENGPQAQGKLRELKKEYNLMHL